MQQTGGREQAREDRNGKRAEQRREAGAHCEREHDERRADRNRSAGSACAELHVGSHPARAVTHRHPADRAGEQVREPERRRQPPRTHAFRLLAEVDLRDVGGGEARVRERERDLRDREHRERRPEDVPVQARERQRRGA